MCPPFGNQADYAVFYLIISAAVVIRLHIVAAHNLL